MNHTPGAQKREVERGVGMVLRVPQCRRVAPLSFEHPRILGHEVKAPIGFDIMKYFAHPGRAYFRAYEGAKNLLRKYVP